MAIRHMNRFSRSLIIREKQIKTTMRHHIPVKLTVIKKSTNENKCWGRCREKESFYTVGGNVSWYSHYGEKDGGCLKI